MNWLMPMITPNETTTRRGQNRNALNMTFLTLHLIIPNPETGVSTFLIIIIIIFFGYEALSTKRKKSGKNDDFGAVGS